MRTPKQVAGIIRQGVREYSPEIDRGNYVLPVEKKVCVVGLLALVICQGWQQAYDFIYNNMHPAIAEKFDVDYGFLRVMDSAFTCQKVATFEEMAEILERFETSEEATEYLKNLPCPE